MTTILNQQLARNIENLTEKSKQVHNEFSGRSYVDSVQLSEREVVGYCKVLSGAATTEHLEEVLLYPVIQQATHPVIRDYMVQHALDENRHFELLNGYLRETFGFVKKKKTFSDVILNSVVLPLMIRLFARTELFALATLYFFEKLSLGFYDQVAKLAQPKGMDQLVELMSQFRRDEMRHLAGVRTLLQVLADNGTKLRRIDVALLRVYLNFFILDISVSRWAIHNRSMRRKMKDISLDIVGYKSTITKMKRETLEEITEQFVRPELRLQVDGAL